MRAPSCRGLADLGTVSVGVLDQHGVVGAGPAPQLAEIALISAPLASSRPEGFCALLVPRAVQLGLPAAGERGLGE